MRYRRRYCIYAILHNMLYRLPLISHINRYLIRYRIKPISYTISVYMRYCIRYRLICDIDGNRYRILTDIAYMQYRLRYRILCNIAFMRYRLLYLLMCCVISYPTSVDIAYDMAFWTAMWPCNALDSTDHTVTVLCLSLMPVVTVSHHLPSIRLQSHRFTSIKHLFASAAALAAGMGAAAAPPAALQLLPLSCSSSRCAAAQHW